MKQSLSAGGLFKSSQKRFNLKWRAGKKGSRRQISADDLHFARPSSVGFLNLIHPNNIQVVGPEELRYLDKLEARAHWETMAQIIDQEPMAILVSDGLTPPDDLIEGAEESHTPLWTSSAPGFELVGFLQHEIGRILAQRCTLHGVFMEVSSIGVLITGDAGSGKSELALELITRGHRLIADDAPDMTLIAPDIIDGTCPPVLQDCLEVRGLGVLNLRALYGDDSVKHNKYLRLIIHLQMVGKEGFQAQDRLRGESSSREILGVLVPTITIPVAPGRNIAVIVEAAVRNHILKMKGYDSADAFLLRHQQHMNSFKSPT